jgi:hypothetical protein
VRRLVESTRRWGLALALLCSACGYQVVRPDAPLPVPAFRLGPVLDRTTEGDLGLRMLRSLRDALASRGGPGLTGDDGPEVPRLEGEVELGPERAVGFDGLGSTYEVELRGRFTLTRPDEPWPRWRSGDVTARVLYARGPTAAAHEAGRRIALEQAAVVLAHRLVERLVERPPAENPE